MKVKCQVCDKKVLKNIVLASVINSNNLLWCLKIFTCRHLCFVSKALPHRRRVCHFLAAHSCIIFHASQFSYLEARFQLDNT